MTNEKREKALVEYVAKNRGSKLEHMGHNDWWRAGYDAAIADSAERVKELDSAEEMFICPRCDGTHWGTPDPTAEESEGKCQGCDFTWKRADDVKVFARVIFP